MTTTSCQRLHMIFPPESAQREFGPNIAPLETQSLGLIRLEFAVEEEEIGGTMAILASPAKSDKPKLLDQVPHVMRRRDYSIRTEQSYIDWIRRFILCHCKRHPLEMREQEVTAFLTHLARDAGR